MIQRRAALILIFTSQIHVQFAENAAVYLGEDH